MTSSDDTAKAHTVESGSTVLLLCDTEPATFAVGGGYTVVQMGVTAPPFVVLGASVAVMTGKTVGSPLRMVIEVTALVKTDVQGGVP